MIPFDDDDTDKQYMREHYTIAHKVLISSDFMQEVTNHPNSQYLFLPFLSNTKDAEFNQYSRELNLLRLVQTIYILCLMYICTDVTR
jgi:hypothetical protein